MSFSFDLRTGLLRFTEARSIVLAMEQRVYVPESIFRNIKRKPRSYYYLLIVLQVMIHFDKVNTDKYILSLFIQLLILSKPMSK